MNIIGYVRISTRDQNEIRQLSALDSLGVNFKKIYIDKNSGKISKDRNINVCWTN